MLAVSTALAGARAGAADDAGDGPDEAMLLFLAEWADADGGLQDPFEYEQMPLNEAEQTQVKEDE